MSKEEEIHTHVRPEEEQDKDKKPPAKKAAKKRGRPRKAKEVKDETPKADETVQPEKVASEKTTPNEYTNVPTLLEGTSGAFNKFGLRERVNYEFTENGLVNWKALIPEDFIVVGRQYLEEHQINPSELSKEEMDDLKSAVDEKDLVILMGGFSELAALRGVLDISYEPLVANEDYHSCKCKIIFRPNYENGGMPFAVEAQACASRSNTNPPFDNYLEAIAENRAFIRVIRKALRINIVGNDELDGDLSDLSPNNAQFIENNATPTVQSALRSYMKMKNRNFEEFAQAAKKQTEDWKEDWKAYEDISDAVATELLGKLQSKEGEG